MRDCLICGGEITDATDSGEHLICEALGGRRQVKGLLHRACNARAGETWDAELAKQLQPLSLMFGIARQRGETAPLRVVTTADEHLTIGPGGHLALTRPVVEKRARDQGGFVYKMQLRSMTEVHQKLQELKRKHPAIDVDAVLRQVTIADTYAEGAVHHDLTIGGEAAGRSIVKSCVAMAFASGVDWRLCEHAIRYLRDPKAPPSFGYYSETEMVAGRPQGVPLHCLAVHANPDSGLIVAYAEYYGVHRVVACLGEGYAGPEIKDAYAIDPRSGTPLHITVDLPFSRTDIDEIYDYQRIPPEPVRAALAAVIGPALDRQNEKEQQRVVSRAVDRAFARCGAKPGEMLTPEHVDRLTRLMAEGIAPFLLHRTRHLRAPFGPAPANEPLGRPKSRR